MSTPTHFAATLRARGKLPAVEVHGPICDRLLLPLASVAAAASGWAGGHRNRSAGSQLLRIQTTLRAWYKIDRDGIAAEPLTQAEHAARFPAEPETPMRGGWPVALFADPTPAPGA